MPNVNPIVDFDKLTDEQIQCAQKLCERTLPAKIQKQIECMADEVELLLENEKDINFPELYKKYPSVRVGARRMLIYVKKRKEKKEK